MSEFFKKFLIEDARRFDPATARFVALGAFGKHPGWDDHIEDLGLETESLTLARRLLYVQGVGGQVDTGAWEKLDAAKRSEGFNHIFVWQRSGQFLLGRMWSSSDGKGRTRYPMVVCAHCIGVSRGWSLDNVLPRLSRVEQACKTAGTAAEVRSVLDQARAALRAGLPTAGDQTQFAAASPQFISRFIADPAFGADHRGWFRILYHLQNQMAAYGRGSFNSKEDVSGLRSQHIRVPATASAPDQTILFWSRFFSSRIDPSVPMLLAFSPQQHWLDAIFGEPVTQDFFCLRATPAALPLATEVPYDLDERFKTQARKLLADFQNGDETTTFSATEPAADSSGGFLKWLRGKTWLLLGGGVLLVAACVAFLLLPDSAKPLALRHLRSAAPAPARADQAPAPDTAVTTSAPQEKPAVAAVNPASPTAPPVAQARVEPAAAPASDPVRAQADAAALEKARLAAEAEARRVADEQEQRETEMARLAATDAARLKSETEAGSQAVTSAVKPMTVATAAVPAAAGLGANVAASASPAQTPPGTALKKVFTNTVGMVLLWVASLPGTAEGGWVGKYEVTQKEFEQVMGTNPSKLKDPLLPVESVTWAEAGEFCSRLTAAEEKANALPGGARYSLPTIAQWDFFLGDAKFEDALTSRASAKTAPAPVGTQSAANQYGLFDVLGNVWEWTADAGPPARHILKGAAFDSRKTMDFQLLDRTTPKLVPGDTRSPDAGFRCVVAVPTASTAR